MAMELEKHLVLNKYFLNMFGFNNFNNLREKLKDTEEGYNTIERSYFVNTLIGLKPEWEDLLLRYDKAIKEYVDKLRQNRRQPNFNLKYFQYLAVLFTEIFLDKYYNDKYRFLNELNTFLEEFNNENKTEIKPFTEENLKKLAFWMATGSGKTLIMHINYWQILKYSQKKWDNIILITPNEGLSEQHRKELELSGIPHKVYDGNKKNSETKDKEIFIIDIYKLTEDSKGGGVKLNIGDFKGENLVFIDEGHKGQKSEEQTWKKSREKLGKDGFLFEYSATFGQVIGKNKDLLEEYAKAIIFDYSYKYFYTDGYGKDFYVYNIRAKKEGKKEVYSKEQQNLLLTAGLLSFSEQLEIFEKYKEELRKYNIEKPLWIFVGSKVTGKGINSDVIRVIQFLGKITNDESYLKENIQKILKGESGLIDNEGNDIFKEKFEYIRKKTIDEVVESIYQKIFNGKGRLELHEIKNADGELGLKTSTTPAEKYFGVVNVGDVRALKKLISESEIEVKEDHFSSSLFFEINGNDSPINILIGAKKFVEGWNSWRVSNMGLINMGKGEGSQIIQLFGRGVRLKGEDYSLKREENPDYKLKALQTLFIFGLNADYMNAFLTTIEKEEVDYEEIVIPIKFNKPEKWQGKIYTIKTRDDFDFLSHPVKLAVDENILRNVKIDLRPKITMAHGLNVGTAEAIIDEPITIPKEYFDFINWQYVYSEIMNYKIAKGMYNLIIDTDAIIQIVESNAYKIFLNEIEGISIENNNGKPRLSIKSFDGMRGLHELILMILKNYIQRLYREEEKRETMRHLDAEPLAVNNHPSMYPEDKKIVLKIPKTLAHETEEVMKQLKEYNPNDNKLPETWKKWDSFIIHFDNHLYTPLIIWKKNKEKIISVPVKLNEGETDFLRDFNEFLSKKNDSLKDYEIFLLRNLSKRGIGFFTRLGFYPDFIIWIMSGSEQHIIFVDPKGIRNLENFEDDKVQFCASDIKDINKDISDRLKNRKENIDLRLDAFIVAVTEYREIKDTWEKRKFKNIDFKNAKEEFKQNNIVFQKDDPEYLEEIFKKAGVIKSS